MNKIFGLFWIDNTDLGIKQLHVVNETLVGLFQSRKEAIDALADMLDTLNQLDLEHKKQQNKKGSNLNDLYFEFEKKVHSLGLKSCLSRDPKYYFIKELTVGKINCNLGNRNE